MTSPPCSRAANGARFPMVDLWAACFRVNAVKKKKTVKRGKKRNAVGGVYMYIIISYRPRTAGGAHGRKTVYYIIIKIKKISSSSWLPVEYCIDVENRA